MSPEHILHTLDILLNRNNNFLGCADNLSYVAAIMGPDVNDPSQHVQKVSSGIMDTLLHLLTFFRNSFIKMLIYSLEMLPLLLPGAHSGPDNPTLE